MNRFTGINPIEGCILYDCRQSTVPSGVTDTKLRTRRSVRDPSGRHPSRLDWRGPGRVNWRQPIRAENGAGKGGAPSTDKQGGRDGTSQAVPWRHDQAAARSDFLGAIRPGPGTSAGGVIEPNNHQDDPHTPKHPAFTSRILHKLQTRFRTEVTTTTLEQRNLDWESHNRWVPPTTSSSLCNLSISDVVRRSWWRTH